jgi:hypothetical protein
LLWTVQWVANLAALPQSLGHAGLMLLQMCYLQVGGVTAQHHLAEEGWKQQAESHTLVQPLPMLLVTHHSRQRQALPTNHAGHQAMRAGGQNVLQEAKKISNDV